MIFKVFKLSIESFNNLFKVKSLNFYINFVNQNQEFDNYFNNNLENLIDFIKIRKANYRMAIMEFENTRTSYNYNQVVNIEYLLIIYINWIYNLNIILSQIAFNIKNYFTLIFFVNFYLIKLNF